MVELKLILLILGIGWMGWISDSIFFSCSLNSKASRVRRWMFLFLLGFGVLSLLLVVLTIFGQFKISRIAAAIFLLLSIHLLKLRHDPLPRSTGFSSFTGFCILLGIFTATSARMIPPYEAAVLGYDGTAYIASSFLLSKTGSLSHEDSLVQSTNRQEREIFRSHVGPYYDRIPGGVQVIDVEKGISGFTFFPLFSAWLALGHLCFTSGSFLYVLNLFSIICLASIFLLGLHMGSVILGLSLVLVLFPFYPQFFFSRMPLSEILTQSLFLSGIWVLAAGLRKDDCLRKDLQILVGILWGCMILCRIDMAFFLLCGLILIFASLSLFHSRLSDWKPLLLCLLASYLLMFYWQLSSGSYLVVWRLSRSHILQNFWNPVVSVLSHMLLKYPVAGAACYFSFSLALLLLFARLRKQKSGTTHPSLRAIWITAVPLMLLLLMSNRLVWISPATMFTRFFVYIPLPVLLYFSAGMILLLYLQITTLKLPFIWIILALFAIPTFFYLLFPSNLPNQPIFVRRFVPATYPLFFLMSFAGWFVFVNRWKVPFRPAAHVLLVGSAVLISWVFFQKISFLMREHLYEKSIPEIQKIASGIPSNALVIIPALDEGYGLEIPLQYVGERSVVSSPVHTSYDPSFDSLIHRALNENRPVILLSFSAMDRAYQLLRNYKATPLMEGDLQIRILPGFDAETFPDHSAQALFRYQQFQIDRKNPPKHKLEIGYTDRDVTFLHFHPEETGFRWSTGKSEIRDFLNPTDGNDIDLILSLRNDLIHQKDDQISVTVNDGQAAQYVGNSTGDYHFRIAGNSTKEIRSVTITCSTFVPKDLGINADPRKLGIPFVRLRFEQVKVH